MKKTVALILLGSAFALPNISQAEASTVNSAPKTINQHIRVVKGDVHSFSTQFQYDREDLQKSYNALYRWLANHHATPDKHPSEKPEIPAPDYKPSPEVKPEVPSEPQQPETPSETPEAGPSDEPTPQPEPTPEPEPEQKPEVTPVPTPPATEVPEEQPNHAPDANQSSATQIEKAVLTLTNAERQKAGLQPLQMDDKLMDSARQKSADMATNHYFSHTSPTYGSPFDQMKANGITYRAAAENIAQGQRSAEEVVTGWMNSPGHRQNILTPGYTHIGIGYDSNGHYWTQQFIQK